MKQSEMFGETKRKLIFRIIKTYRVLYNQELSRQEAIKLGGTSLKSLRACNKSLKAQLPPKPKRLTRLEKLQKDGFLNKSVFTLDIPPRANKYFKYLKVNTVSDLLQYSFKEFILLRNCGRRTAKAIQRELEANGYLWK